MELNCESLQKIVQSFSLVQSCDIIRSGALRISTLFNFPDGSSIDLFLKPTNDLPGNLILSDFGQTADYVADLQFDLFATQKRRVMLEDICSSLGVAQAHDSFEIIIESQQITDLSQAIVRLAQACIRASDLVFTQRLKNVGSFQDEVEEFLATSQIHYEPDIVLIGDFDQAVKVDFKVKGRKVISLIQTLSSRSNTHVASNETFRRWYDLQSYKQSNQFLTILDQASGGYRDDDVKRLSQMSSVFGFPKEQEQIFEALGA